MYSRLVRKVGNSRPVQISRLDWAGLGWTGLGDFGPQTRKVVSSREWLLSSVDLDARPHKNHLITCLVLRLGVRASAHINMYIPDERFREVLFCTVPPFVCRGRKHGGGSENRAAASLIKLSG